MPQQVYSVSTLGGNTTNPYLTDKLRAAAQPYFRFRQFLDVKESIGKGRGDTWLFDKRGNVQTQGGTLSETNTIPETQFITNQGTGVITEYGNAVPYTAKLDVLGKFDIGATTEAALRDDQVKVLESAAGAQFILTDFVAVCTLTNSVVISTTGTASATAGADLTAANTQSIVNFMKKKLIPKYDGKNYICISSITALAGMYADTAAGGWVTVSQYTDTYAKNIFMGEVGTYFGVRFVEETGYLNNFIGTGAVHGQAVFMGADNVYEAVAIPEEIRHKVSMDYGRDQGLCWYALLGFKLVWNFAVDAEQHVVLVGSL
jgi:N4-gp56 family major capsid protein